jgi:hypothetical protein
MSLLFRLRNDKVVLNENCAKLIPEIKSVSEDELLFVVLSVDYYSPYHQYPMAEKLRKASIHTWGEDRMDKYQSKRIQNAMLAYLSLQYDHRRELLNTYINMIAQQNQKLQNSDNDRDIQAILKNINELEKQIKNLKKEIEQSNDFDNSIEGGGKLSLIEIFQKNRKAFKAIDPPINPWKPAPPKSKEV